MKNCLKGLDLAVLNLKDIVDLYNILFKFNDTRKRKILECIYYVISNSKYKNNKKVSRLALKQGKTLVMSNIIYIRRIHMSAEIGIINKYGIALATDSAVTVADGQGCYTTANKLFALSKFEPVAIMIYSNADYMGVPVEIIIKEYRKELKYIKRVLE